MRLVRDEEYYDDDEAVMVEDQDDTMIAGEAPDGAVDEAREEADVEENTSDESLPPVNLALMEALLFSTHHPLTAGRLAELMDFPSSKPIRAAIKDLNAQYESAARAFRVEQVAGGYQLLT